MAYPKSLSYYINKISNVSKNTVQITPYRTDAVTSGQIIVCDFPANAMIDLDSLVWHFLGTTSSTNFCAFPRHIESIISKIMVEVNNQTIGSCNNLSDLYNIMYNLNQGTDLQNKRALYQNGTPQVAPTANNAATPFKVQNFLGFLGSVQPRILDLGVIGSLRLHITLEGTNVLIKSATSTNEKYVLDNIYFTVDSISIDDGMYYESKDAFLGSGGVIEMPFDNFYSSLFSVSTFNQSNRFSIASQSADYMLACFPLNRSLQQVDPVTGQTSYFSYAADDGTSANSLVDWQFQINNIQVPQYRALKHDAFPLLLNVMGTSQTQDGGICSSITNAQVWTSKYWVAGIRLDLLTDVDERTLSGLPTTGTNSTVAFISTGVGSYNPGNLLVFCKSTAVLLVGAGKQCKVDL
jgi:hypothetical protein